MAAAWIRDVAGTPRDWAFSLAGTTAAGVALALLGPFGTFLNASVGLRLAYWISLLWISVLIYLPALRVGAGLCSRLDLPPWFGLTAAILGASVPMAFISWSVAIRIWTRYVASMSPLDWYGETLIVAVPLSLGYVTLGGSFRKEPSDPAVFAPQAETLRAASTASLSFLSRLPPRLGRDLLCLQMEDHYVRAHTAAGSDLILIPLHQAVAELDGLEGLLVHRSWWVARRAVAAVERDGRSLRLKLSNGVTAPVSRRAVAALKAAGWIE